MLASTFQEDLSYLWPTGQSLNPDEKLNINLALTQLHEQEDFEEALFWGKISGLSSDYYIAQTLQYSNQYEFPLKTFYWCKTRDWNFKEFPVLN
mmetsp:Transcript_28769/g.5202  ORF Transcript_28769/g.5202 Transcript_28769/m.5202 type:complete len:94 (+) Transcript_28769:3-284(+)